MYLFCVTNLTLYASICWFCTVTTAHPLVFTLSSILLLFLLVVLFCSSISMSLYLVKIICWLARLCVWLIDFACLIIVFLLSVFAHAVPKCLKYKKGEIVTWCVLGFQVHNHQTDVSTLSVKLVLMFFWVLTHCHHYISRPDSGGSIFWLNSTVKVRLFSTFSFGVK